MLLKAAEEHSLNLANCIVIGDRWKDLVAAHAARAQCILVLTGAGHDTLHERESGLMYNQLLLQPIYRKLLNLSLHH